MSSPKKNLKTAAVTSTSSISTDFFLSLATAPVLVAVLSVDAVCSWLQAAGVASEEVFRGDRLPILHFPDLERQD